MLTFKLIMLILYVVVIFIVDCSVITLATLGLESLVSKKDYNKLLKENGKWYFICSALVYILIIFVNILKLL